MADHLQAYKLHGRAGNRDGWIALDTIDFYVDWRNYRGGGLIVHDTSINLLELTTRKGE